MEVVGGLGETGIQVVAGRGLRVGNLGDRWGPAVAEIETLLAVGIHQVGTVLETQALALGLLGGSNFLLDQPIPQVGVWGHLDQLLPEDPPLLSNREYQVHLEGQKSDCPAAGLSCIQPKKYPINGINTLKCSHYENKCIKYIMFFVCIRCMNLKYVLIDELCYLN